VIYERHLSSRIVVLWFVIVAAFSICGDGCQGTNGSKIDDGQKFADSAMIAIVANWDKQELLRRASEEMHEEANAITDVDSLFEHWKSLGRLMEYNGSTGGTKVIDNPETGRLVTASYSASALFEKGSATIEVELIWRDKGWQIMSFRVFPDSQPANQPQMHGGV
jgi:hypothetical protein